MTKDSINIEVEFRPTTNGMGLFCGKIKIAEYWINGLRSKNDPKEFRVASLIRELKPSRIDVETEKECKSECMKILSDFLQKLSHKSV